MYFGLLIYVNQHHDRFVNYFPLSLMVKSSIKVDACGLHKIRENRCESNAPKQNLPL